MIIGMYKQKYNHEIDYRGHACFHMFWHGHKKGLK